MTTTALVDATNPDEVEEYLSGGGVVSVSLPLAMAKVIRDLQSKLLTLPNHRYFYFWCSNCATRVHVETTEQADDSRGVEDHPDPIKCPMCGYAFMADWDNIAAYDESFRNRGTWADFERWRAEQKP